MMKKLLVVFILSLATCGKLFAEAPHEVKVLMLQREKAIQKVNETAKKELRKLKLLYMKRGNLEAANQAVAESEMISSKGGGSSDDEKRFLRAVVGKKWTWGANYEQSGEWIQINANGTGSYNGQQLLKWRLFEDRTVAVFFTSYKQTMVLKWDESFKGYEGLSVNFSEVSGRALLK